MSSVTTRGFGISGGFSGDAGLVVTQGYALGESVELFAEPGTLWIAEPGGRLWIAEAGGRIWVAIGGIGMANRMVRNPISEAAPGAGAFRPVMDFGDMKELHELDGDDEPVVIESCTVSISPVTNPTATVTSPATLESDYRVSTLISGGLAGTEYTVTFVATLSTGQVLPPRAATWNAK